MSLVSHAVLQLLDRAGPPLFMHSSIVCTRTTVDNYQLPEVCYIDHKRKHYTLTTHVHSLLIFYARTSLPCNILVNYNGLVPYAWPIYMSLVTNTLLVVVFNLHYRGLGFFYNIMDVRIGELKCIEQKLVTTFLSPGFLGPLFLFLV